MIIVIVDKTGFRIGPTDGEQIDDLSSMGWT